MEPIQSKMFVFNNNEAIKKHGRKRSCITNIPEPNSLEQTFFNHPSSAVGNKLGREDQHSKPMSGTHEEILKGSFSIGQPKASFGEFPEP